MGGSGPPKLVFKTNYLASGKRGNGRGRLAWSTSESRIDAWLSVMCSTPLTLHAAEQLSTVRDGIASTLGLYPRKKTSAERTLVGCRKDNMSTASFGRGSVTQ